ncbi:hypothetical protein BKA15_001414 [Microlunatus parietis]|uniref:Uncharacterized protein n=1 Tax=Microlunatus parietis TaxID=682979 RepID=A0A7Y9I4F6_9ACTN|nr:hypothetical protein [Microlunatus parietis]NYE70085.1 hypothetical protein [Microlunatus parietis]
MTLTTTQTAEADRLVDLVRAQFGLPDLVVQLGRLLADTGRPPLTRSRPPAAGPVNNSSPSWPAIPVSITTTTAGSSGSG